MLTRQADCFPEGVDQQMTRTQYKFHTVSIMAKHCIKLPFPAVCSAVMYMLMYVQYTCSNMW